MSKPLSEEDLKDLLGGINDVLQKKVSIDADSQRPKKDSGFKKMVSWLVMFFCEAPGEPSMRRLLCFCAFVFGVAICFLGLKHEITEAVKTIAITILSLSFGAMAAGRFAEAMDRSGQ